MRENVLRWLEIGLRNPWIREACDPPFTRKSFNRCATREELRERIWHGNWCLGQAFCLGDLCFIQQVDGGDEWLAIRGALSFESVSLRRSIEIGELDEWLDCVERATDEQLRTLEYMRCEECPGHGCPPGDGPTDGCDDPEGCGFHDDEALEHVMAIERREIEAMLAVAKSKGD